MSTFRKGLLALFSLVVLVAIAGVLLVYNSRAAIALSRKARVQVEVENFDIQATEQVLAQGREMLKNKGCVECHGADLGGKTFMQSPLMGTISGSNLTSGRGGIAPVYSLNADWERAIRFGVGPQGRMLNFMPAQDYHSMGREELTAIVAALKALAPVDRDLPSIEVGPLAGVLYSIGKLPVLFSFQALDASKQR